MCSLRPVVAAWRAHLRDGAWVVSSMTSCSDRSAVVLDLLLLWPAVRLKRVACASDGQE